MRSGTLPPAGDPPPIHHAASLEGRIRELLLGHPSVEAVGLVGSRAEGRARARSDWDFVVETRDFDAVAAGLPELLAPLGCLAQQWDPLSPDWCWMLMLPGPTKVDLVFRGRRHELQPPWRPAVDNLEAIDRHFWDWVLWLDSKPRSNQALHKAELDKLFVHLLGPLGVSERPRSVGEAVAAYRMARSSAEARIGVTVPRGLEAEVAPVLTPS